MTKGLYDQYVLTISLVLIPFGKEGVQFLKLFQQEFKKLLEEKISIDKQTR